MEGRKGYSEGEKVTCLSVSKLLEIQEKQAVQGVTNESCDCAGKDFF